MKLSAKTRYGVRAVFDIAFHTQSSPGVAVPAKEIAEREKVPLRYLEQIFQDLRRSGLVESKRGPRGGYFLKRAADKTTLADLVLALEGASSGLFSKDEPSSEEEALGTPISGPVTSVLWEELDEVVRAWFSGITVHDMVQRGNSLGLGNETNLNMYFI